MSQTDMNVANASGAVVRADINAHLDAIITQSSGATEPTTKFAYMWWADTTTGILKQRNAANTAWVSKITLATGLIIGTDVQAYDANNVVSDANNTFTKAQRGSITALTSTAASVAIDFALNNHFSHTLTENTTFANPTNIVAGQGGSIFVTQAAGLYTVAYGSYWDFGAAGAPTITATSGVEDRIDYIAKTTTRIEAVWSGGA